MHATEDFEYDCEARECPLVWRVTIYGVRRIFAAIIARIGTAV